MKQVLIPSVLTCLLGLTACQPESAPEERQPEGIDPTVLPDERGGLPPAAYIGRWSADPVWCAAPSGDRRPIELTATEFRGYENLCQITELARDPDEVAVEAWTTTFTCMAEGEITTEPVRIVAGAEDLSITWVNRHQTIDWRRCP